MPNNSPDVLIVDDTPEFLKVIASALEPSFRVTACLTGQEALACLERTAFALLVFDVNLPDADGHDLCRSARASRLNAKTPIIMVSGQRDSEDRDRAIAAGADDYMAKPFKLAQLREAIARHSAADAAQAPSAPKLGAELRTTLVQTFARNAPDALTRMHKAIEESSYEKLAFEAHKLKSSCALLGFIEAHALAERLERVAVYQSASAAVDDFARLRTSVEHQLAELSKSPNAQ